MKIIKNKFTEEVIENIINKFNVGLYDFTNAFPLNNIPIIFVLSRILTDYLTYEYENNL
jgi:hypothetical protein